MLRTAAGKRGIAESSADELQGGSPPVAGGAPLPTIFLITDGCVEHEREICEYMGRMAEIEQQQQSLAPKAEQRWGKAASTAPRLFTFAIGPYANHFFLKQLALYGRGAFDAAFRPHLIRNQMVKMLESAQVSEECFSVSFPANYCFGSVSKICSSHFYSGQ